MSYEDGKTTAFNHGMPTTRQTGDPAFMQGYRDAEASRKFWANQASQNNQFQPSYSQQSSSAPSAPLTLSGAVKGLGLAGAVLGIIYAVIGLNGRLVVSVEWAIGGLLLGGIAGVAVWALAKALELAFWILGWCLKIGFVLLVIYLIAKFVIGP